MQDEPTSNSWGGQNVFDVYSKSNDKASDGNRIPNGRFPVKVSPARHTRRRLLQRGFTLIELMIVMAIISVMIAIPFIRNLSSVPKKAC